MGAPQSFGEMLRSWRKSRGLSQLALAEQAEVSTRHLSFLETGRAAPRREMILRLGRTLEVPLGQRKTLLEAAGFAATFKRRPLDDEVLAPVTEALRQLIDHPARQQRFGSGRHSSRRGPASFGKRAALSFP